MPITFTPDNEPYLGNDKLRIFDELIVTTLSANATIAPLTNQSEQSPLKLAACKLIPAGFSLALSIRELIRQGYLYGAFTLVRPMTERAVTIQYLYRFPDKQIIWDNGWNYNKRPSLTKMLSELSGSENHVVTSAITGTLNSLTHGDPDSAMWNTILIDEGGFGHPVSKILNRPELCDRVCLDAMAWLSVLIGTACSIYPDSSQEPK